jgi:hypothetical protein
MADGETSGLVGEVSLSASLEVAEGVAAEEMEREEPEESGHTDDDEDEDEINHSALPKGTVRANTPKGRAQKSDIWKHVKRIASHDSLHLGMNVECTHVCVYPLRMVATVRSVSATRLSNFSVPRSARMLDGARRSR